MASRRNGETDLSGSETIAPEAAPLNRRLAEVVGKSSSASRVTLQPRRPVSVGLAKGA
jgi:hypothetical protein